MKRKTHNIKHVKKEKNKNFFMFHVSCFMQQAGFTILELIIVLAVFAIVISTTASIFISIIGQQKRISEEQELLNQTSYVVEYMTRPIMTAVKASTTTCLGAVGRLYLLTHKDMAAGVYQGIKFIASDNNCQEFFLDADGILKETKGATTTNILSSNFKINYARFIIDGDKAKSGSPVPPADTFHPRITISLSVETKNIQDKQKKIIQITVSKRDLNI